MSDKPVVKIRAGSVSAAIFENKAVVNGREMAIWKVTLQRSYKDANGQWQVTNSYSRNDIPLALYCLRKAFDKMIEKNAADDIEG